MIPTFIAPDSTYRTDSMLRVGGAYALSPVNHRAARRVVGMIMDGAVLRKSRKEVGGKKGGHFINTSIFQWSWHFITRHTTGFLLTTISEIPRKSVF